MTPSDAGDRLTRGLLVSLALVVLLLAFNAGLAYHNTRQVREDGRRVAHSNEVLDALDNLLLTMTEAETGQRGYVITGDRRYLEPYNAARAAVRDDLQQARRLTADDARQQAWLPPLEQAIQAKLDELEQTIALRDKDTEAARKFVLTHLGRNLMNAIRTRIATMEAEERVLLQERQDHAARSYRTAVISGLLTAILGLAMVAAFAYFVFRDVRAQQQAKAALRSTAEELARSNHDLEQFAYVASHDLKEPLRMVTGFLSLLKIQMEGRLDAKGEECIAYATDGAQRMQRLIDDLLLYARAGRSPVNQPTDVGEVLDTVQRSLKAAIEESGAVITCDRLPTVASNPVELAQVFQNLIGNAIKFRGQRRPEIHVGARREGDAWLFTVRDNGIGIDPQFAERIFLIFQRLHAREQYPGTGIGLAICKKIVERHGGRIWVETREGAGTTFAFTIPATS